MVNSAVYHQYVPRILTFSHLPDSPERVELLRRYELSKEHSIIQEYIKALYTHTPKLITCHAGRRVWKTWYAKLSLVYTATDPFASIKNYIVLGPTVAQAVKIWFQDLIDMIPPNLIKDIIYTTHKIILTNDNNITITGADQPSRAEGEPVDGVIIDEAGDIAVDIYSVNIQPMLIDTGGWCVILGVSRSKAGTWYKELCEKIERGEYGDFAKSFTWSAEDFMPENEIKLVKRSIHRTVYDREYIGIFTLDSQLAYMNYKRDRHQDEQPLDKSRAICVACDFNINIMSWELLQVKTSGVFAFDEIVDRDTNVYRMIYVLKKKLIEIHGNEQVARMHRINFYGDASGTARDSSASESCWIAIENAFVGWNVELFIPSANPAINDRLFVVDTMLETADLSIKFKHSAKCTELQKDLETVTRKMVDSVKKATVGERTHSSDGVGYMLHYLFKPDRTTMMITSLR